MNCCRNVLVVFFVAFLSSHKATDATDYEIPDACEKYQTITLDGRTMKGSTFIFQNNGGLTVKFRFSPFHNSPNLLLRFDDDTNDTNLYHYPMKTVERKSMSFSLIGNWSDSAGGVVYYNSVGNHTKDCDNRTATNLRVRATYNVTRVMNKTLSIQGRDNCGVKVTPDGIVNRGNSCITTLDFGNGKNISARWYRSTLTTDNGPVSFRVYSNCSDADVLLYYQENCRSMTTPSTNPTAQTTKSSEATVTKSPTTKEPTVSTTPGTAASKSTVSTTPSSGLNVVAHILPVTFAMILSMAQW
ncbi:unnamed protein product [Calicophoron daubneyi]|uniref:Uncharacterized protein n=1 Tax=Calicophoron daubneyi TaxID=300641 RepID=A0AAV2TKW6_CALDB